MNININESRLVVDANDRSFHLCSCPQEDLKDKERLAVECQPQSFVVYGRYTVDLQLLSQGSRFYIGRSRQCDPRLVVLS